MKLPGDKTLASAQTSAHPHGRVHAPARKQARPYLPAPHPPPRTPSLALCGRADASARTLEKKKKIFFKNIFLGSCLLKKTGKKLFSFRFSNPQDPRASRAKPREE
jgi:hypothetical protein